MHFGVSMFPTDYAIRPDELAGALEERGFESLWVPEHTHIPASRRSPWPGGPNLPKEYWHVSFDRIWAHPKPLQKPHPPILMGGDGPTTFDRVVEFCDGWMPIGFRAPGVVDKIPTLKAAAAKAGRDPKSISVSLFGVKPDRATVDRLEGAGVDRLVFMAPSDTREKVLPLLDAYAAVSR